MAILRSGKRRSMARRRPSLWRRLLQIFGVAAVAAALWGGWRGVAALLDADFLRTRYLEVSGCRVLPEEMVTEVLEPCLGRPLLRLPMDSLRLKVGKLPRVRALSLDRRVPGTLRCSIQEAEPLALLLEGGVFHELDQDGNRLLRFGTPPPDLPILVAGGLVGSDSLVKLGRQALHALEAASFDLGREVSEMRVEERGLVFRRNESETWVILGWTDFPARVAAYGEVQPLLAAENSFPRELDLRYRDQVVARD